MVAFDAARTGGMGRPNTNALTSYLLAEWLDPCLELVVSSDLQKDMDAAQINK